MDRQSGIVALRNLKTDRVYLFYSDDIRKDCIDMRFKLDMGMHPCRSLQADYTETGLEVFRFDTVEYTTDKGRLEEIGRSMNLYG
ncbi:MAG: hypothetical protein IKR80_03000 [Spirochaetales bacterium]|nr:hypothetical protein [Spirochaetales bacterium]MBQ7508064.1 hypothetical protein [Spirochaetales bacterium]MBR6347901.1 hypothetical protein [Spirochaetales bacterium]